MALRLARRALADDLASSIKVFEGKGWKSQDLKTWNSVHTPFVQLIAELCEKNAGAAYDSYISALDKLFQVDDWTNKDIMNAKDLTLPAGVRFTLGWMQDANCLQMIYNVRNDLFEVANQRLNRVPVVLTFADDKGKSGSAAVQKEILARYAKEYPNDKRKPADPVVLVDKSLGDGYTALVGSIMYDAAFGRQARLAADAGGEGATDFLKVKAIPAAPTPNVASPFASIYNRLAALDKA
eukprot:NODE_3985_length_829_cov_142.847578_g3962_i0.p1 GENE.NODE_3985_length_829_cov_142.847578_g3962_i0~~NODE_3985_length_829_cov_142.847578_g3962_i0.p1  ORF type:complete len:239 (-),score=68.88 NODE_3985_length_829_cov_142.847578_g3962_i0:52-768(-)